MEDKEVLLNVEIPYENQLIITTNKGTCRYEVTAEWGHICWFESIDEETLNQYINEEIIEIENKGWLLTIKTANGYFDIETRSEWDYCTEIEQIE